MTEAYMYTKYIMCVKSVGSERDVRVWGGLCAEIVRIYGLVLFRAEVRW